MSTVPPDPPDNSNENFNNEDARKIKREARPTNGPVKSGNGDNLGQKKGNRHRATVRSISPSPDTSTTGSAPSSPRSTPTSAAASPANARTRSRSSSTESTNSNISDTDQPGSTTPLTSIATKPVATPMSSEALEEVAKSIELDVATSKDEDVNIETFLKKCRAKLTEVSSSSPSGDQEKSKIQAEAIQRAITVLEAYPDMYSPTDFHFTIKQGRNTLSEIYNQIIEKANKALEATNPHADNKHSDEAAKVGTTQAASSGYGGTPQGKDTDDEPLGFDVTTQPGAPSLAADSTPVAAATTAAITPPPSTGAALSNEERWKNYVLEARKTAAEEEAEERRQLGLTEPTAAEAVFIEEEYWKTRGDIARKQEEERSKRSTLFAQSPLDINKITLEQEAIWIKRGDDLRKERKEKTEANRAKFASSAASSAAALGPLSPAAAPPAAGAAASPASSATSLGTAVPAAEAHSSNAFWGQQLLDLRKKAEGDEKDFREKLVSDTPAAAKQVFNLAKHWTSLGDNIRESRKNHSSLHTGTKWEDEVLKQEALWQARADELEKKQAAANRTNSAAAVAPGPSSSAATARPSAAAAPPPAPAAAAPAAAAGAKPVAQNAQQQRNAQNAQAAAQPQNAATNLGGKFQQFQSQPRSISASAGGPPFTPGASSQLHQKPSHSSRQSQANLAANANFAYELEKFIKSNHAIKAELENRYKEDEDGVTFKFGNKGGDETTLIANIEATNEYDQQEIIRSLGKNNIPKVEVTNPPSDVAIDFMLHMSKGIMPLTMSQSCGDPETIVRLLEAAALSGASIHFAPEDERLMGKLDQQDPDEKSLYDRYQFLSSLTEKGHEKQLEAFRAHVRKEEDAGVDWEYGKTKFNPGDLRSNITFHGGP